MNSRLFSSAIILLSLLLCVLSCKEESPTESAPPITFSIDGHKVTVHNLWKSGGSHTANTEGLISFIETVTRDNESHTLEWSNIVHEWLAVTRFDVVIDGKDYRYPEPVRGNLPYDLIRFRLNGVNYDYRSAYSEDSKPYAMYTPADTALHRRETYYLIAARSVDDHKNRINFLTIMAVNYPLPPYYYSSWRINFLNTDNSGVTNNIAGGTVDIAELIGRGTVGAQIWGRLPGPFIDGTDTVSNVEFSVKRIQ